MIKTLLDIDVILNILEPGEEFFLHSFSVLNLCDLQKIEGWISDLRFMIGDDCFISHGAMFINDPFSIGGPAQGNRDLWKETRVGDHVSIGTNSTILPIKICSNVVIGAGSVVTKDITASGMYAGNPARLLRRL